MEGINEIFAGEAQEILQNLEPEIVNLEETKDQEVIHRIFRYVHTLKGSSSMAGLMELSEFTHKLENLIDAVRAGTLQVNESLIDILLGSMDWIKMNIFGVEEDIDVGKVKVELIGQIEKYMQNRKLTSLQDSPDNLRLNISGSNSIFKDKVKKITDSNKGKENQYGYKFFRIRAGFKDSIFKNGIDPLIIIEDIVSLGRISKRKVDRSKLPAFENFDPEKCYLNWDIIIRTQHTINQIEDVFLFVKDDNIVKIEDVTKSYKVPDILEAYKLGEIMLSKNIISEDELATVLKSQETNGKKIAELMVEKGYASDEDVRHALEEQDKIKKKIESTTVRVATSKLDKLLNLLGEIVINQAAITRVGEEVGGEDGERVINAVYGLDRTTRELQEEIMGIRMIPIGPTFEQFKRFVRDTAKSFGKEIRLEIMGTETELDKTVIEKIDDPLKHMIRNAIDHGIESPEERKNSGKDLKGMIRLKAYHQEGGVYIEVSDDGRGIDKVKIREKAEHLGLINASDEISDEKLHSLLFSPGFSTAEKIGSLSGRGVGMDVVKTNIDELKGTIKVESEIDKGTTFIIKLPLTLAIIDGMLIRVGNNKYIIPLFSIIESIQPRKDEVKTIEGKGEVIFVRGEYVSLLRIYDIFGIVEAKYKNPWESLVVVVKSNGIVLALMVDELIGQEQIVIKSIDSDLTKNRAISGASILGDGKIALIMDIHGLIGEIT